MLRVDVRDEDGGERGLERAFRRRSAWSGRVTDAPRPRPDYRESKNLPGVQRIRRIAVPRDDESIILPVSQRWFPGRLEDGPRSLWLILGPLESGRERRGALHFSVDREGWIDWPGTRDKTTPTPLTPSAVSRISRKVLLLSYGWRKEESSSPSAPCGTIGGGGIVVRPI